MFVLSSKGTRLLLPPRIHKHSPSVGRMPGAQAFVGPQGRISCLPFEFLPVQAALIDVTRPRWGELDREARDGDLLLHTGILDAVQAIAAMHAADWRRDRNLVGSRVCLIRG